MNVIFDHSTPISVRTFLSPLHQVTTCPQMGWQKYRTGNCLPAGEEAGFDVMVTAVNNIKHQENLAKRRISLVVSTSNYWADVHVVSEQIANYADQALPGSYAAVQVPYSRLKQERK